MSSSARKTKSKTRKHIFLHYSPTLLPQLQLLQRLDQLFTHNYYLFRMITERTSAVSSSFSTKLTCAQSGGSAVEEKCTL